MFLSVVECCGVLLGVTECGEMLRSVAEFLSVEEYFLVCPTVPSVS